MRDGLLWIAMIVIVLLVFFTNWLQDTVNNEMISLMEMNTNLIADVETLAIQNRILILRAYGLDEEAENEIFR